MLFRSVFDLLVQPLLRRLQGEAVAEALPNVAPGGTPWRPNARLQAVPVALRCDDGALRAELVRPSPSGDPFGLVATDGYVLVPQQARHGEVATLPLVLGSRGVRLS